MKRKTYCSFCNLTVVKEGHISVCPNCQGHLHDLGSVKVCACCGKTCPKSGAQEPVVEPELIPAINLEAYPFAVQKCQGDEPWHLGENDGRKRSLFGDTTSVKPDVRRERASVHCRTSPHRCDLPSERERPASRSDIAVNLE